MASGSGAKAMRKRSGEISRNENEGTEGKSTASVKTAAQEEGEKKNEITVSFSSSSETRKAESECSIMQY